MCLIKVFSEQEHFNPRMGMLEGSRKRIVAFDSSDDVAFFEFGSVNLPSL